MKNKKLTNKELFAEYLKLQSLFEKTGVLNDILEDSTSFEWNFINDKVDATKVSSEIMAALNTIKYQVFDLNCKIYDEGQKLAKQILTVK